jgi:hypothetical protein
MERADTIRPEAVVGSVEYLAADSAVNRRYVAPGAELNTGRYDRHAITVRNARRAGRAFSLEEDGFTLRRQPTAVRDFGDAAEVDRVFPAEADRLIRDLTGADKVVAFSWMVRSAGVTGAAVQPPAADVHVDYTSERAEGLARALLARGGDPGFAFRRFMAINLWRALSGPAQDWPLALCDGNSVGADEGVPNAMIRVEALPDPAHIPAEMPAEGLVGEAFVFRWNPAHRWWYFPDMTPDEVLAFKLYDSERHGAWRVPHVSFADPGAAGAPPRQSVEIRTVAYFS